MKKFLAILLVLVMVLPMCLVAQAADTKSGTKPFYLVNWQDDITDYDNIFMLFDLNASYSEATNSVVLGCNWQGERASSIPELAKIMKEEFDARPDGTRYINYPLAIDSVVKPTYMIYLDEAVALFKAWNDEFFAEYKRIGGKLDGVIIDLEYNGTGAYYIHKAYTSGGSEIDAEEGTTVELEKNSQIYNNIVSHPLYATEIRPELEKRGFEFREPLGEKSEIYGISVRGSKNSEIWDAVMRNRQCAYINEACSAVFELYPEATVSNYRFLGGKGWQESIGQTGGYSDGGNTIYAGNTANENFYLRRPYSNFFETENGFITPKFYSSAVYEDTAFHSFMFEVNTFKNALEANGPDSRLSAWVAGFNYTSSAAGARKIRLTPYFSEAIYHLGLTTTENLIGYIVGPRDTEIEGEPYDYEDNMLIFSELLNELTRVAGMADRKVIPVPTQWSSDFVISGVTGSGKNVWRISPDTSTGTSLEAFKVEGAADPTFRIGGQTITFPGGKIITDSKVSHIGTCGYWVETSADVSPVITNDVDRYSQFPAFEETYDTYKAGMDYTYDSVQYRTSWLFKKGKSAKIVVETEKGNDKNQVLAVTGNVTLRNVKVVENVTAGDTYAENQAWEITATIPANMGEKEEVTLLSIYSESEQVIDGGFQFKGGKLYYSNAGKYVAFDGLDVSAGGKFTLKRSMDFNTEGAFTCDYTVYDASGKELASAKAIPVAKKVEVPVTAIGLNTSGISGTIYLDDYKIYANGVGADFALYDAELGIELTDLTAKREKSTAYRLSWMNATASDKAYSVVAAFYNGDKLVEEKVIKEVKMAPGSESVELGVVDVADGQTVVVYLRNDSSDAPTTTPGNQNSGNTAKKSNNTVLLVAVIVAAVVLVDVIVVAVIVICKKMKEAAEEESQDESKEESAE